MLELDHVDGMMHSIDRQVMQGAHITHLSFLILVSSFHLHMFPHLSTLFSLLHLLCCPYPLLSLCSPCLLPPSISSPGQRCFSDVVIHSCSSHCLMVMWLKSAWQHGEQHSPSWDAGSGSITQTHTWRQTLASFHLFYHVQFIVSTYGFSCHYHRNDS